MFIGRHKNYVNISTALVIPADFVVVFLSFKGHPSYFYHSRAVAIQISIACEKKYHRLNIQSILGSDGGGVGVFVVVIVVGIFTSRTPTAVSKQS